MCIENNKETKEVVIIVIVRLNQQNYYPLGCHPFCYVNIFCGSVYYCGVIRTMTVVDHGGVVVPGKTAKGNDYSSAIGKPLKTRGW